jgi:hypothetical protein
MVLTVQLDPRDRKDPLDRLDHKGLQGTMVLMELTD